MSSNKRPLSVKLSGLSARAQFAVTDFTSSKTIDGVRAALDRLPNPVETMEKISLNPKVIREIVAYIYGPQTYERFTLELERKQRVWAVEHYGSWVTANRKRIVAIDKRIKALGGEQ